MMEIVYEDDQMIIVNKVAGKFTQSSRPQDQDLVSEVLTYRRRKKETPYIALINRLDVPVSGLVLFAKTREEGARLNRQMQEAGFNKKYFAVLCGRPAQKSGTLTDYLVKDGRTHLAQVAEKKTPGSKLAELKYETICTVVDQEQAYTFIRIHLMTGRHHQIRVQFSSRGLPILGDVKYGGESVEQYLSRSARKIPVKKSEIALCAYALEVDGRTFSIRPKWYIE